MSPLFVADKLPSPTLIPLLAMVFLTACSTPHSAETRDEETRYLSSRSATQPRSRHLEASTSPAVPSTSTTAISDPLATRRAETVRRVEALSASECDSVCLRLQLIPRDEILDPEVKPQKELLRYTRRLRSAEEFDALADRR